MEFPPQNFSLDETIFTIRALTPADLEAIYSIEASSFPVPWSREALHQELTENTRAFNLGVFSENTLVAYVITYLVIDEVHILILATAAAFRRRGIAQILLRCLLEYLKRQGVVQAYLEVRHSNQAAIQLYAKLGFKIQGIRKNYYQYGNEDAVVMGCTLKTLESV